MSALMELARAVANKVEDVARASSGHFWIPQARLRHFQALRDSSVIRAFWCGQSVFRAYLVRGDKTHRISRGSRSSRRELYVRRDTTCLSGLSGLVDSRAKTPCALIPLRASAWWNSFG